MTLTYGYDPSGDVTSIKDSLSGSGAAGQGHHDATFMTMRCGWERSRSRSAGRSPPKSSTPMMRAGV